MDSPKLFHTYIRINEYLKFIKSRWTPLRHPIVKAIAQIWPPQFFQLLVCIQLEWGASLSQEVVTQTTDSTGVMILLSVTEGANSVV